MSTTTTEQCNGIGTSHCWHTTGKYAPMTAPHNWAEFICCHCGKVRTAENYVFAVGNHGKHAPDSSVIPSQGYSIW